MTTNASTQRYQPWRASLALTLVLLGISYLTITTWHGETKLPRNSHMPPSPALQNTQHLTKPQAPTKRKIPSTLHIETKRRDYKTLISTIKSDAINHGGTADTFTPTYVFSSPSTRIYLKVPENYLKRIGPLLQPEPDYASWAHGLTPYQPTDHAPPTVSLTISVEQSNALLGLLCMTLLPIIFMVGAPTFYFVIKRYP